MLRQFGLIGYPLSHSFSKGYFAEKFSREGINDAVYSNFPLSSISEFTTLCEQYPNLCGLNVTIPYKEAVIPYLDELSEEARLIGAVNTIVLGEGKKRGTIQTHTGLNKASGPCSGRSILRAWYWERVAQARRWCMCSTN